MNPMMKCGHAANATSKRDGEVDLPCCAICVCFVVAEKQPDLTGRQARCSCFRKEPSDPQKLAFFEHRPESEFDSYYCGCNGWD